MQMFRLMFQHQAINKINNKKVNDKKVNGIVRLLTHFGGKHADSRGYQARKEITSVVLILMFSSNTLFTTQDLGPTRIDFNLGTPRSEIPSHYPTVNHNHCDYQTQNKQMVKSP
jgi:hypothetical protein